MKIQFLGAAGVVTGSCYILTADVGTSIMIDCGLYQGSPELDRANFEPFAANVSELLGVVITHAHLDHCGRLPLLTKAKFRGPVWSTPTTRDIMEISLFDTAKINAQDHPDHPLYTAEDVNDLLNLCQTVEYNHSFKIGPFELVYRDAGHIIGSASVEIIDTSATTAMKKVVFSGDLGNTPQDLIEPTTLIDESDIVVMESTYGDRVHPSENFSAQLQLEIQEIEKTGGTLLIPVFAIERSQELLHVLAHLKKDGEIQESTPVFFDSPMAEKVTEVFEQYPDLFNPEFKREAMSGTPFHFPGLKVVDSQMEKADLADFQGAKVIIAGSGMMTGGKILMHAQQYLPLSTTRLLFVGYQGENTLGRQILAGQKNVIIKGERITVNATVTYSQALSSHADQPKLLNWLAHIQGVQKVFITHGDQPARVAFAQKISEKLPQIETVLPLPNQIS